MTLGASPQRTRSPRSGNQRLAVILAVIFQIGATFLPSFGIGEDIGSRSDATRTLITPAGWAFAIWGPLFAGSVLFAIYQALPLQRHSALLDRIAWPAAGAFAGNGLWAIYTQLNALTIISAIIIVGALICILAVYRILVLVDRNFKTSERWLVMLPLSALAAWLTVATIVNIAAMLKFYGIEFGADSAWLAAGVLVVGGFIALLAVGRGRGNPIYAGVFIWALVAIYAQGGQAEMPVAYATLLAGGLVLAALVVELRHASNRQHWLG